MDDDTTPDLADEMSALALFVLAAFSAVWLVLAITELVRGM